MIFAMHVFTYGSLMFPEVWNAVVGRSFKTVEGAVTGYSIFRVRNATFPGITPSDDACRVAGLVYLDVDDVSVGRLDRFEDTSFYERLSLPIDCCDGERRTAAAYVVPASSRHVLTAEPWTAAAFVSSGGLADFQARFQGFSRLGGAG
jgi:gamma-glutamylcyclotransferase (GGCT)/AIG2-like uncharacterized protein YtfP